MFVATLRADGPLDGTQLFADESAARFYLEGGAEVSAAKVLDLENRRQLVWVDPATRVRVIYGAADKVQREASRGEPVQRPGEREKPGTGAIRSERERTFRRESRQSA